MRMLASPRNISIKGNLMNFKWLASAAVLLAASPVLATDVLTFHNDPARTGLNAHETTLTPSNVNQNSFGLLFNLSVDGKVDAQPLFVMSAAIGVARKNVVVIATEHDSVYVFDADSGAQYWKVSLLVGSETPSDNRGCDQVTPQSGLPATPVIMREAGNPGTIYVVAMSKSTREKGTFSPHRIHPLSLADASETAGSPVEVQSSFPGKGPGNAGSGHVIFKPSAYQQRSTLLFHNNLLY